ncbi:hypothetical protein TNCV_4998711 [Trichonephila clavipes]|nr:hypothetical protein TNCV_4998711 [Trichonephila clavipes]
MRHFDLDCSNVKYSEDHLYSKNVESFLKCPGVRTQGSSGLLDNTHSGLELRHASIWLDNVDSSLKVRLVTPTTLFK